MDITINELGQLTPDSYILLDMRGDVEVGHGIIPGAIHMSKEEILEKYSGGLVKQMRQRRQKEKILRKRS